VIREGAAVTSGGAAASTVPPIRREVLVDAGPAVAFEVFTARIGLWWPIAEKSVYGADGTVAFAGGQIIEQSPDGRRAVWGTVTRWEPPTRVAFTWHPGHAPERASHVEVGFAAAGPQTLVTLTHTGWEVFADPAAARAEYDHGWPVVLDRYQERVGKHDDEGSGETWVALLHRPGPTAPQEGSILEDPRFADHFAFLTRMREAGYLVAAGPLTDAAAEGMAILRLPGTGQAGHATLLATLDDASVVQGLLAVTVRPWQVMLQARS
jgi:uncharacterized protein YndB with AHSA1/START domain/uncharacterized protein YciI